MSASADISKFLRGLGQAKVRVEAAALRSVDRFGEAILGEAQDRCPVKTGDLKDSTASEPAEMKGGRISKVIGFNMEYAAAVHENIHANFSLERNPRAQAKFLEKAVMEMQPKMAAFVRDEVTEALR
jgi:hypothetical protein